MGSDYTSRTCQATGCETRTHGSKPYCHAHVEHNPYAEAVLARLQARRDELEAAEQAAG